MDALLQAVAELHVQMEQLILVVVLVVAIVVLIVEVQE
jgi:hypothetical protein